jgi:hypothetical protein
MKFVFRTLFILLPMGIVGFLMLQMVIANEMIVIGDRLAQTETRISQLEEQNEYLKRSLTALSSIKRVQTEAKSMGFIEPMSYIAFDQGLLPVALKR